MLPTEHVARVVREDPRAAEILLGLLGAAAFSPRFASLLDPVPVPSTYAPRNEDVHIDALRHDLRTIPKLTDTSGRTFPEMSLRARALVEYALFGPVDPGDVSPQMLLRSDRLRRAPDDVREGLECSQFHVTCQKPPRPQVLLAEDKPDGVFTAFHGATIDRWYCILRYGIRVRSPEPYNVSNGRVYGDGAYLTTESSLALSFAPHSPLTLTAVPVSGLSAYGTFTVVKQTFDDCTHRPGSSGSAHGVPTNYVVVADENRIRLDGITILASTAASPRHCLPIRESMMLRLLWNLYSSIGPFGCVILVYVTCLVIVGIR